MAKDPAESAEKKIREGWIRSWMAVEVLAVTPEAAKSSLERHVGLMEKEDNCIVYRKEYRKPEKVENPMPNVKEGYSMVVELHLAAHSMDKLVFLAMNYAPSGIEVLEPDKITVKAGEAQGILNSISEMMHKFVSAGVGGVVVNT